MYTVLCRCSDFEAIHILKAVRQSRMALYAWNAIWKAKRRMKRTQISQIKTRMSEIHPYVFSPVEPCQHLACHIRCQ